MRFIAGSARGRRIFSVPKDMPVRPISGRIRQSLFDMLRPRITASRLLDLFAGTGAVGLEALSRGAERVVFVDREPKCLKVIEKNLARIGWSDKASVLRGDATSPLGWVAYRSRVEVFDIVFMGPPYVDPEKRPLALAQGVLKRVADADLLAPDGLIVVQHHFKEPVEAPPGYTLFRRTRYGDTRLSFLRRTGHVPGPLSSEAPERID